MAFERLRVQIPPSPYGPRGRLPYLRFLFVAVVDFKVRVSKALLGSARFFCRIIRFEFRRVRVWALDAAAYGVEGNDE